MLKIKNHWLIIVSNGRITNKMVVFARNEHQAVKWFYQHNSWYQSNNYIVTSVKKLEVNKESEEQC